MDRNESGWRQVDDPQRAGREKQSEGSEYVLAAAFRANEGSGYEVQEAPHSCLQRRFVTPLHAALAADRTSHSNYGDRGWSQHLECRRALSIVVMQEQIFLKKTKKTIMTKILAVMTKVTNSIKNKHVRYFGARNFAFCKDVSQFMLDDSFSRRRR